MISKFTSERDIRNAASLVRCSMLEALPENPEGQFSEVFLMRVDEFEAVRRKIEKRRIIQKRLAAVAAAFAITMTMLLSLNTEVRAAVATWFKEVYNTFTTYWFDPEIKNDLPVFELTGVPEGYICIYDETLINSRSMLYQNETNPSDIFSVRYALLQPDAPLTLSYPDTEFVFSKIEVNGYAGELYTSKNPDESHALIWVDESNGVVFTVTSLGNPDDMLHIASLLKLVK